MEGGGKGDQPTTQCSRVGVIVWPSLHVLGLEAGTA